MGVRLSVKQFSNEILGSIQRGGTRGCRVKTVFVVYDFDYIETTDWLSYETKSVLAVCATIEAARAYIKRYNERCLCEYLGEKNIDEVEYFER